MSFQKGHKLSPGRKKGSKNNLTILREKMGADSLKKIHPIMMELIESASTPKSLKIAIGIPILKIILGEKITADINHHDILSMEHIDAIVKRMKDASLIKPRKA